MKKYSKEKRKQLVLVVLVSVMILSGLWFGLIKLQKENLEAIGLRKNAAELKLKQVKTSIANSADLEAEVAKASAALAQLEETMASGDLYSWVINTVKQFKLPYKVEIPQFSQIDGPKNTTLLPDFPYQQATLSIAGTAYYQDLGRFVADFENTFPYIRVLNMSLEPASALASTDREKLAFKLDIATLVKPGA